jgi:acyl-coenzyme A thioesterase PaaI-like protein
MTNPSEKNATKKFDQNQPGPDWESLVVPGTDSSWTEAVPFPKGHVSHSYVSGRKDSRTIRVRYFEQKAKRKFAGRAWFGPETEGPPGHAHGGSQAALLDEGMGAAAWLSGKTVLAAKIEINFRRPLPLGTVLTVRSEITKIEGRKVYTSGRLESDDGGVFSEGTGLFIVIDPEALLRQAGLKE